MEMEDQKLIHLDHIKYKLFNYNKMTEEFQDLWKNRDELLVAVARYGGPIALIKNKEYVNFDQKHSSVERNVVYFFDHYGKLISKIKFVYTDRITCFDFLESEFLLILLDNGQFQLVDPFKGKFSNDSLEMRFLPLTKTKIVKGKVYENGLVFYTELMQFFCVPKIESEKFFQFQDPNLAQLIREVILQQRESQGEVQQPSQEEIVQFHLDFIVVPPKEGFSYSERVEVHINHPESGVIVLIGDEGIRIDNGNPNIDYEFTNIPRRPNNKILMKVRKIAQSPKGSKFAYLIEGCIFILSQNYFDKNIQQIEDKRIQFADKSGKVLLRQILWCSESCVVLVYDRHFMMVGKMKVVKRQLRHAFGYAESDGVRFVTQQTSLALRPASIEYVNVFKLLSYEPGAILYQYYTSLVAKKPDCQDIRQNSQEYIAQAVKECLSAAIFEVNEARQRQLLKAAQYGKLQLSGFQQFNHEELNQVCKRLRVVRSIRMNSVVPRLITCAQFEEINKQHLIGILLRYQLHFLAHQICKHEQFPESSELIASIYIDWACCKIGTQESDSHLCDTIKHRLLSQEHSKSTVSFTEIAQRAIQLKKEDLATMLINEEPDIDKRVALFICMRNFEKAVYIASKERCSNLLNLIILKMYKLQRKNFTELFKTFRTNEIACDHLVQFLKVFEKEELLELLKELGRNDDRGVEMIKMAYEEKAGVTEKVKKMDEAVSLFSQGKQNFKSITKEYQSILKNKQNAQKSFTEKPLAHSLIALFEKQDLKSAEKFSVVCKVPEQRYQIYKLRHFGKNRKWKKFDSIVEKYNNSRKEKLIPYDEIAQICEEFGDRERAKKYILLYDDIDDKIYFLIGIECFKEAAKIAFEEQNVQTLQEIRFNTPDYVLKSQIDDYIKQLTG